MAVDPTTVPAWGPSYAGPSQVDFQTDDSGSMAAAPPDPPDFARIIPISAIQDVKQQQAADDWASQQQSDLAEQWGQVHEADLNSMVQNWHDAWMQPGEAPPPEPAPVQPEAAPERPPVDVQGNPTQMPASNPVVDQFISGLGGLLDKMGQGANAVKTALAPQTAEATPMPLIQDTGVGHAVGDAAQAYVAQGEQQRQQMFGDQQANEAAFARGEQPEITPAQANAATGMVMQPGITGKAGEAVGAVAREALTADHPIVQAVVDAAEQAGSKVNLNSVAKLLQSPGFNPENLAKATGRLGPVQSTALAAWKVAQDPEMTQAVMDAAKPAEAAASATATEATLPATLAKATPKYGYGPKQFPVNFESDVDKAAYIVGNAGESKAHAAYQAWLNDQGLDAAAIAERSQAIRTAVKSQAAGAVDGSTIHVPSQTNANPTPFTRPPAAAAPVAESPNAVATPAATDAASGMAQEFDQLPGLAGRGDVGNLLGDVAPLEASAPAGKTPEPVSTEPPYTGAGYSMLADNPVVKGLNAVQGVLKQAVIGGSVFHPLVESLQLGRTALAEAAPVAGVKGLAAANRAFADSGFAQRYAAENADVINQAEQAGATMVRVGGPINPDVQQVGNTIVRTLLSSTGSGVAGYASAKAQGQSDEDALKRAGMFALGGAGVAQIAPALNAALWGRMVPVAKVEAFKMLEPTYGADVAAKRINDIFGGQNLAKLGRNPEVQTILRTTFLSPDWLESWARNLGAVVKPGPEGNAARKWWAATGVSSALTLEGMNMAINGHPTTDNEPGRQMQLEVTPLLKAAGQNPQQRVYADVLELGPLGSVLNAAARGGVGAVGSNLATGHLNVLPDIALQAERNQAPTGGQIVSQGTPAERAALPEVAAAAAHVAPIGLSGFEKGTVPLPAQAASAASGIRLSEGPAVKQKTPAPSNPLASPSTQGVAQPKNLSQLRTFLSSPTQKSKTSSPLAPGSNLAKLRTLK